MSILRSRFAARPDTHQSPQMRYRSNHALICERASGRSGPTIYPFPFWKAPVGMCCSRQLAAPDIDFTRRMGSTCAVRLSFADRHPKMIQPRNVICMSSGHFSVAISCQFDSDCGFETGGRAGSAWASTRALSSIPFCRASWTPVAMEGAQAPLSESKAELRWTSPVMLQSVLEVGIEVVGK